MSISYYEGRYTGAQIDAGIAAIRFLLDAALYGFRIDKTNPDPETRVEYLYDAAGMTPARMNYTTGQFDYGSWANAWFITGNKPCALKYDGTIDYYLDPNDYTKKADGTASDVSDSSYAGNFMASMPVVWIKRWEDERYLYYAFSDKQINSSFKAYAHDAGDGTINDMIYLPMFKGVIVDGKMRSIAGVTPQGSTSATEEKTAAEACGTGWQMWDWSKHELLSDLLTLISHSTNSQVAFGMGDVDTRDDTDAQTHGMLTTGTAGSGQFYGANDMTHHVKLFHIEDYWGNRYDRCLGLNRVNRYYMCKPVRPYAVDSDSTYVQIAPIPIAPDGNVWQKDQLCTSYGTFPASSGGSSSTYVCDFHNVGNPDTDALALIGGMCGDGLYPGSRALHLCRQSNNQLWFIGGSVCYNAPHNIRGKRRR